MKRYPHGSFDENDREIIILIGTPKKHKPYFRRIRRESRCSYFADYLYWGGCVVKHPLWMIPANRGIRQGIRIRRNNGERCDEEVVWSGTEWVAA